MSKPAAGRDDEAPLSKVQPPEWPDEWVRALNDASLRQATSAAPGAHTSVGAGSGVGNLVARVRETIAQLRRTRGRNKSPTKEQVAIRFDPEILAAFRASGRGWQTRMNSALKEWMKEGSLPKARVRAKAGG